MSMTPTVVCNNILRRSFDEHIPISPMKLQKLMYFISCEYAKTTETDLFSEDFGVWQYGPVLPTVYDEFKAFGGASITKFATDVNGVAYAINESGAPNLKCAIDKVWSCFKDFPAITLSSITHTDGSGWSRAFAEHRTRITTDDMKADNTYAKYMCS